MMKFKSVIIIMIPLLMYSCITGSNVNRGSLSGAMEASTDDSSSGGFVPEEPEYDPPHSSVDEYEPIDTESEDVDLIDIENFFILIRGGATLLNDPYFSSSKGGEVLVGGGEEIMKFYLFTGLELLETNSSHAVSQSIKSPLYLYAGAEFRIHPFHNLEYFNPYIGTRIGGFILNWQYMNTIYSGSDSINYDSLGGLLLGIGAGVDFIHTDKLRVGISCMAGADLFGIETSQGFTNDYFDINGDITLSVEAGYSF